MDERIKGSILEQEPPPVSDFVNRVRFCAKALAYGAVNDLWEPKISVNSFGNTWSQNGISNYHDRFLVYFYGTTEKNIEQSGLYSWEGLHPRISFLEAYDYVKQIDTRIYPEGDGDMLQRVMPSQRYDYYLLTDKAFALLETPLTPPKVFISYKREVSTVLGLLIESRLKALPGDINPFIDKDLKPGKPWHEQLQQRINNCDTFISLLGSEKSFSENVLDEIRWAKEAGKDIISIWHGDFKKIDPAQCPDSELAEFLGNNHAILVSGVDALAYEMAITQLENALHYF